MEEGKVIISNQDAFDAKVKRIIQEGIENFHVVTDFDRTLSQPEPMDHTQTREKAFCTIAVVLNSKHVSQKYRDEAHQLFLHYYPTEICHEMSMEEKIPLMIEWYGKVHSKLLAENLTLEKFKETVRDSNFLLRDGALKFLQSILKERIPCLVFSAGYASVIDQVLKQNYSLDLPEDFFHIIGNWLLFDDNGKHVGFSELVHMFNKNESHTKGHDYEQQVFERQNLLLLGDGIGDVHMADGMGHRVVLKVGFLNHKIEERLELYRELYDVVIIGVNADFSFVSDHILAPLINGNKAVNAPCAESR